MTFKNILAALALLSVGWAHSAQSASVCDSTAPWGQPRIELNNSELICRQGYSLLHNNTTKTAAWVSYVLERSHTLSCAARVDSFAADPRLKPGSRSEPSDYRRSGFDMGHMAPNADQSWDPQVQRESFLLSNIAPQLPELNRGPWRELEAAVRTWAYQKTSVTVIVGPVYGRDPATIGANRVAVPQAFYKIVVDNLQANHVAFLFPHQGPWGNTINRMQTTVSEIEKQTGIVFSVPGDKNVITPLWPVVSRPLAAARAAACRP